MRAHDITFPSTIGTHVRGLRTFLTARNWAGVKVQPKLPDVKSARMITVRDDGGTDRDTVLPRRHTFNIWADTAVDAENLAIAVAGYCRSVRALSVSGPIEVTDDIDDVIVVAGATLHHYLVSAVITVRAIDL